MELFNKGGGAAGLPDLLEASVSVRPQPGQVKSPWVPSALQWLHHHWGTHTHTLASQEFFSGSDVGLNALLVSGLSIRTLWISSPTLLIFPGICAANIEAPFPQSVDVLSHLICRAGD